MGTSKREIITAVFEMDEVWGNLLVAALSHKSALGLDPRDYSDLS
jgi:hypothetical protein